MTSDRDAASNYTDINSPFWQSRPEPAAFFSREPDHETVCGCGARGNGYCKPQSDGERDAAALERWADFQDATLTGSLAYAVEDADRAEVARWTSSARAYAARLRDGSFKPGPSPGS